MSTPPGRGPSVWIIVLVALIAALSVLSFLLDGPGPAGP